MNNMKIQVWNSNEIIIYVEWNQNVNPNDQNTIKDTRTPVCKPWFWLSVTWWCVEKTKCDNSTIDITLSNWQIWSCKNQWATEVWDWSKSCTWDVKTCKSWLWNYYTWWSNKSIDESWYTPIKNISENTWVKDKWPCPTWRHVPTTEDISKTCKVFYPDRSCDESRNTSQNDWEIYKNFYSYDRAKDILKLPFVKNTTNNEYNWYLIIYSNAKNNFESQFIWQVYKDITIDYYKDKISVYPIWLNQVIPRGSAS
jgi:hypothetical protein